MSRSKYLAPFTGASGDTVFRWVDKRFRTGSPNHCTKFGHRKPTEVKEAKPVYFMICFDGISNLEQLLSKKKALQGLEHFTPGFNWVYFWAFIRSVSTLVFRPTLDQFARSLAGYLSHSGSGIQCVTRERSQSNTSFIDC